MRLTDKQARAIKTQTKSVLVSAAAGSGKTSVLAKRVARLVEGGADIRTMLVMTFTNAAAAEMRQRIARELREEALRQGEKRLYEQAEFVAVSDISTFHSFCGKVVRKNYAILGLSPTVRIMDAGEMNRMKTQTARELFDGLYEEEDGDFLRLVQRYTRRGDDRQLMEYLFRIYDHIMSKPEPFAWAERSEHKNNEEYIARLKAQYDGNIMEHLLRAKRLMDASATLSGSKYPQQLAQDEACATLLGEAYSYARDNGVAALRKNSVGMKIPSITKGLGDECKKRIQDLYAQARKELKQALAGDDYENFHVTAGTELAHTQQDVCAMLALVRQFHEYYAECKSELNVLDYSDMEHFALRAFEDEEVRRMYADLYQYIFVDEYQDTNPVQESIIKAVSGDGNLFMVGDIKQSIYKFRLADPLIFKEKSQEFRAQAEGGELILMNDNFRSKSGVIDAVNGIMECVMCETLGEIRYDEGERLVGSARGGKTEILLACEADDGEDETRSRHAVEAEMIARSIERELAGEVTDKKTGAMRKAAFGDFAVLVRSRSDMIYLLKAELDRRGIPCSIDVEQARELKEIELFVNILRLVDNRRQDIPLLSVMRSFIGGMNEEEFARIRIGADRDKEPFYESAQMYAAEKEDTLARKLRSFYEKLDYLKTCAQSLAMPEFLSLVATEFDFETYLACVPDGEMKRTAFSQFLGMAAQLCAAQGNSLYLLLRALHETKKRDGAYVKAAMAAGGADCVHITTIHSSKGLEYPIVYVANLERRLTVQDFKNRMLIHSDYGLMMQYIDEQSLVRRSTIELELAKKQIRREYLSEELRVLYVAMTRAREKLFLAGSVGNLEKARHEWAMMHDMGSYEDAKSMLDWIMAANAGGQIPVRFAGDEEAGEKEKTTFDFDEYCNKMAKVEDRAELLSAARQPDIPAKVSVSAVKQSNAANIRRFLIPDLQPDDEEITGARLGTLVHSMMERVVLTGQDVREAALEMEARKLLTGQEREAVLAHTEWIEGFLKTSLYERIKTAGRVLKEQPFNLEVKAQSIGYEGEGSMMVQGILDLAFLEDKWVLVDYKTDRVTHNTVEQAAQGYAVQLELYARALEEITGIPVKEKYLYFLRLQRCMEV